MISRLRFHHLDLFSGIGGFAIAAQAAGFTTIGFSEIDPYASAVLKKHWPDIPNYGDIRTVPALRCDLITGGFPCQPFSCAGKQRGAADNRYLWPTMLDVIGRCKPAWVLAENVPGIIGMELDRVQSDLEGIGYKTGTLVIPACAVDARHRRSRVWIVAYSESTPWRARLRENKPEGFEQSIATDDGEAVAHTHGEPPGRPAIARSQCCKWLPEPAVLRVAHGIPNRVDRLKCLGNSIVPQVAQVILENIATILDFPVQPKKPPTHKDLFSGVKS